MKETIILTLILLVVGCSHEYQERGLEDFKLVDASHTGCLKSVVSTRNDDNEIFIIRSTGDNTYEFEHQDVIFNCCLPEGIEVDVYVQNDTIFYTDKEKVKGNCKCICPYNTTAQVSGIENGDYVLCFLSEGSCLGTVELNFNENLHEEIIVSALE